jgi:predicted nucleic-acid-binding protein
MFWIDRFVQEKELNTEHIFEVEGESGPNFIPLAVVIEHVKIATRRERAQVKNMLVRIDFANGDAMRFFKHLARAVAI